MTNVKHVHVRILITVALIIGSMSVTFVGLYIFHAHLDKSFVEATVPNLQSDEPSVRPIARVYSLPNRLLIPRLNIDASVLPMGLTTAGAMESPKTKQDTGWYSLGVRPGNIGSAVIAGHLGLEYEAVFGKLHLLAAGDTFFCY